MLLKVALQQTGEASTVTGLVLGHFMNGVVNGIEAGSLGILGNTELVLAGTSLSSSTLFQIGLRIPYNLTQQLCKTTGVVSLLESIALERLGNLRIALAVSLTGHSQILTNLATLAIKMSTQVINHLFADALGLAVTNLVNGSIGHVGIVLQFRELAGRSLTNGALLGSSIAFVDISTNGADKLFLHCFNLLS